MVTSYVCGERYAQRQTYLSSSIISAFDLVSDLVGIGRAAAVSCNP